jgi:hypothetical protein
MLRHLFPNGVGTMENFGIPRRPNGPRKGETTPVNWRRGLLRVWLLISGAWIMAWSIFLVLEGIQWGFKTTGLLTVPILLFGPPFALLLFGVAARWAFRGFNVDKRFSTD